ncbi:MAG: hypothetical protein J6X19_07350, partial [Clostridia bacterium]|nr:hypothetical protein [Clostridia bacterium]
QEILTRVNEARNEMDHHVTPRGTLDDLAAALEDQLRREIAASRGQGNAVKIIGALLKGNEKGGRKALAYPWTDAEGRQCVCDGYQAYRLREALPLPERPENIGDGIALERIFPADLTGFKRLPMPSANDLKSFIAVERAKASKRNLEPGWDFGPHAPTVNACYLLNAARIFPAASEILWSTLMSPLVITCEAGDALLMPIRTEKTMPAEQTDEERRAIERQSEQQAQNRREDAERSEIIRKAREDADKAWDDVKAAMQTQIKARDALEQTNDRGDAAAAIDEWVAACEKEAKARIRCCASTQVYNPTFSIEPSMFADIVHKLFIRETVAA